MINFKKRLNSFLFIVTLLGGRKTSGKGNGSFDETGGPKDPKGTKSWKTAPDLKGRVSKDNSLLSIFMLYCRLFINFKMS